MRQFFLFIIIALMPNMPLHSVPKARKSTSLQTAKAVPVQTEATDDDYRVSRFDDSNGLSQWHVTRMLQDPAGFMWFATWGGLNRFDGYDFTVFKSKPGDGTGLTSDRIRNIIMGDDGNIYCLIDEQVWRFNLSTYSFEKPSTDVRRDVPRQDKSASEQLITMSRQHFPSISGGKKVTVGRHVFNDVKQTFTDAQGNQWFVTSYGVEKISRVSSPLRIIDCVPKDIVRCIYRDAEGRVWVTSRNSGVVSIDPHQEKSPSHGFLGRDGKLHSSPVSFSPIYTVLQMRDGTVWLGSKPDGLFRLKKLSDGHFSVENFRRGTPSMVAAGTTLNSDTIYDMKEDSEGRLWIATHGGGLNVICNPTARGTADEPFVVCNKDNRFSGYPAGEMNMRRLMLIGDSILVATTIDGLLVARLQRDASSATRRRGVSAAAMPPSVTFRVHRRESDRKESLSCSALMNIVVDDRQRMFISTESGGIDMLARPLTATPSPLCDERLEFRHYGTSEGLGSDAVMSMTAHRGLIMAQCNNMIARMNVDRGVIDNYNDSFFAMPVHFSDAEPLPLEDGSWLLSLETGLAVIDETAFRRSDYVPPIVLSALQLDSEAPDYTFACRDTLFLESSRRNITFRFAALDYKDNSRIRYATRMIYDGYFLNEADTIACTPLQTSRTVSFFDLKPGVYHLEITSTNAEGLLADNRRTVTVIVEPRFGETPWAFLLYVVLVVAVIAAINITLLYIIIITKTIITCLYQGNCERTTLPNTCSTNGRLKTSSGLTTVIWDDSEGNTSAALTAMKSRRKK
ncbi:MAG: two-component regulator propeller domain-containing protein [Prevotella sp.]